MSEKKRLDILVVERGLAESREKARTLIMSGAVFVDGAREDKPGAAFRDSDELRIDVAGAGLKYVSRGGLKLEKALDVFGIGLRNLVCMDIGASTGGFTDCMLQNGAALVYAVDVGYGQLAWKLRNDSRVVTMEKTNVRYLTAESIGAEKLDFAAADVSFISLSKVIPAVKPLLRSDAGMVLLIKPQFEAGRTEVGKNGVVRDKKVHERVIDEVISMAEAEGLSAAGLDYSPIKGPKGNIEYLLYLTTCAGPGIGRDITAKVVAEAHAALRSCAGTA